MHNRLLPLALLAFAASWADRVPAAAPAPTAVKPPVDLSHDKALYVVGYAHLDTQWRWTYPQVIGEFIANTLHNNFALFQKYPDYVFNFSGSRRYEFMQEYYPQDFETLKGYVASGQWFPCGSSVDESDSMVPSAESLVRQVLYGNHYFRREFGIASDEFMLPDCFGFPEALPSILAHCGIAGFSTQKLTWGSAIGIPFKVGVWIGVDGKSVIAALDPGAYRAKVEEDLSQSSSWLARIDHTGQLSGTYADYHYYGDGDRGGSPDDPSVDWIERGVHGTGPVRVISAAADRMVHDITPAERQKLPTYQGELLLTQHSSGSITSAAAMKNWNRRNELLADAAERTSVAASWLGAAPYPSARLYTGWDLLLGSQMHDMLPGTSLPKAYEYCWNDESLAQNQFLSVLGDGLGAVSEQLDTRAQGVPLVVYNPLSLDREDPVEAWVTFPSSPPTAVAVFNSAGRAVASQVLDRDGHRLKVLFLAQVPSVGFAVFEVRAAVHAPSARPGGLTVSSAGLENARYRVSLNAAGDIASIYDKLNHREILAAPHRLAFQFEKPTVFPAWNMDWEDQRKAPRGYVTGPVTIRVAESGPVRVALAVTRESEGSRFTQIIRLASGGAADRVEVAATIDWQSRECCLKAVFPMTVSNPSATYDSQLGAISRGNNGPTKYEVPQHQWFDLTDRSGAYGVAVLNDSKYGSDKPDDRTLRLTLLYTPGVRNSYQDQASQDEGRHHLVYALFGHTGDWRQADVPWEAARLNQPMVVLQATPHSGVLGRSFSLLRIDSRQVMVSAVKKAEDSDEIVVRLRELDGKLARGVHLAFHSPLVTAREIDGQERPIGAATLDHGALLTDITGYSLRAFALRVAPSPHQPTAAWSEPAPLSYDRTASSALGSAGQKFDSTGQSYAAEMLPATITADGVKFVLGPPAQPNCVECRGQTIALPEGDYDRVYILAASADGDRAGAFSAGASPTTVAVPEWTGFIGQWDDRQWKGEVPELTYAWHNALEGLKPAYLKTAEVAWYASHSHDAAGANQIYHYSYLFKFGFDRAPGARKLVLPNNPQIRIFAVSVAKGCHDHGALASGVVDEFQDHRLDAPRFSRLPGNYRDTQQVEIYHPTYWHEGEIHYTLDGSDPVAASPIYRAPLWLPTAVTLKARYLHGTSSGPIGTAAYRVNDSTAPSVVAAVATTVAPQVRLTFSEPVGRQSAENPRHYSLTSGETGGPTITGASLADDQRTVTLQLSRPLTPSMAGVRLITSDIADCSPAANRSSRQSVSIVAATPVLTVPTAHCPADAKTLPLPAGASSWTLNVFVRADEPIPNRTLIVGFGSTDNTEDGTGRYFGKFADGLHFWSRKAELETTTPVDIGHWQMLTASYDGRTLTLYKDGERIEEFAPTLVDDKPELAIAPLDPWDKMRRFQGELRQLTFWNQSLSAEALRLIYNADQPSAP